MPIRRKKKWIMEYMCHESRIGMRPFVRKKEFANKAGAQTGQEE